MICLPRLFVFLTYLIFQTCSKSIKIESKSSIEIAYSKHIKLLSVDVLLSSKIYFFIIKVNGKSVIRMYENSANTNGDFIKLFDPDLFAQSIAVDWINYNLYWVDSTNRFIEIVKLNRYFNTSVGRNNRRIIINQSTYAIDSIVIDPIDGYLFVLRQIVGTILERYNLDGTGKFQIHRNERRDCHNLTIDRHRKMLYWFEGKGNIHRVDYQGKTGCLIHIKKKWTKWAPSHLTSVNSDLLFINDHNIWQIKDLHCGSNNVEPFFNIFGGSWQPVGIINSAPQLAKHASLSNNEARQKCQGIYVSGKCLCATPFYQKLKNQCAPLEKSLLIYTHQGIQQINMHNTYPHKNIDFTLASKPYLILEPLLQHKFIPVYITPDPITNAIFFIDVVQSTETVKYFSFLNVSYPSPVRIVEFPSHVLLKPTLISFDPYSRNLYWLNVSEWSIDLCVGYVDLSDATKIIVKHTGILRRMNKFRKISRCTNLIIDPINQHLFITCVIDLEVSIIRFNLDATNEYTIIQTKNHKSGLAIDPANQRLYYAEVSTSKIISLDYWGRKKRIEFNKSGPDISGLTYLDGHIYWINTVSMKVISIPVNKDNTNSKSTVIASIYNLQSVMLLMTGLTVSPDANKFGDNGSPCGRIRNGSSVKCAQLCFPARSWSSKLSGYRCGCSLVNRIHLSNDENENSCKQMHNSSFADSSSTSSSSSVGSSFTDFTKNTQNPSQFVNSVIMILYNSTTAFVYTLNTHTHSLSNGSLLMTSRSIYNLVLDITRSSMYWIDKYTNCLLISRLNQNNNNRQPFTKSGDSLYCSYGNEDSLTQISLDNIHNNMYLLITNRIWSRIEVMRLPFPIGTSKNKFDQSKQSLRYLVSHKMRDVNGSILAVNVVPKLKIILIFSQNPTQSEFVLNQCELDGSSCLKVFSKSIKTLKFKEDRTSSLIKSPVVDQEANYLYWLNRDCSSLYQYKINNSLWSSYYTRNRKIDPFRNKKPKAIDLSRYVRLFNLDLQPPMMLMSQCQPNVHPLMDANKNVLHFWMDNGHIYQLNMKKYTKSTTITSEELIQIYQANTIAPPSYPPYSIDTRFSKNILAVKPGHLDDSASTGHFKIAVNSKQAPYQNYIICPSDTTAQVNKLCEHLCLPTSTKQCGCASTALQYPDLVYSDDGYDKLERCVDKSTQLLAVTHDGELLSMNIADKTDQDVIVQPWYTLQLFPRQIGSAEVQVTLTDSLYWSKYGLVISIDVEGKVWCYNIKTETKSFVKHVEVSTNEEAKDEDDSYDEIYRHLIEHHTSSQLVQIDPRYRITLDTITGTFYWLDWMFGVVVSESIAYNSKTGAVSLTNLGIVVDLRKSNRRPLELILCSFSSNLIYLTGELSVKVKNKQRTPGNSKVSPEFWRKYRIEMMEFDGFRHRVLIENYRERPRSLTMEPGSGTLFWSTVTKDKSGRQTMNIYSLLIRWNDYTIRDVYRQQENLNLTLTRHIYLSNNDPKISVVPITVLKSRIFFPYQSVNVDDPTGTSSIVTVDAQKYIQLYKWSYLSYKRKKIIKLLIKTSVEKHKSSLLGLAERLHPCSSKPCSHFCMSTLPIDLSNIASSSLMLSPSLSHKLSMGARYRCGCPLPLFLVTDSFGNQVCTQKADLSNKGICPAGYITCRAGRIYDKKQLIKGHCLPMDLKCDKKEDCLDGSDESGCGLGGPLVQSVIHYTGPCNKTYQYSCSSNANSGIGTNSKTSKCIKLSKVCDGFKDCIGGDDESCCKDKSSIFQCFTGVSSQKRCIPSKFRCDNAIDCIDGSDELNCPIISQTPRKDIFYFSKSNSFNSPDAISNDSDLLKKLNSDSSANEKRSFSTVTIALISGPIAGLICLVTLLYIIISAVYRRYKQNHPSHKDIKKKYISKPASLLSGSSSSHQYQLATLSRSRVASVNKTNSQSEYSSGSNYQHHHFHHHHHHHHHPDQENNHHHHHHYQQNNSQIFQTNNVNMIMVVSSPNHSSNHSNYFFENQQKQYHHHTNSYGTTNTHNQYFNQSENDDSSRKFYQSNSSLSSLSECYRRIRDPLPLVTPMPSNHNAILPLQQYHTKTTAPPLFTSRDYQELFMFNNCNNTNSHPSAAILTMQTDRATPNPPAPSSIDEEEDHTSVLLRQNPPRHCSESLSGNINPPPPPSLISATTSSKIRKGNSRKRREPEEYEEQEDIPIAPRNSRVTSTVATSTDDDIPPIDNNVNRSKLDTQHHDRYKTGNYPNCVIQDLLTAISDNNSTSNNGHTPTNNRALHTTRHQRIRKKTKYRQHRHHNRHHLNTHTNNVLPPPPSPNSISNSSYKMTPL